MSAVSTGKVILGDKNDKDYNKLGFYKSFNATHVPDLIRPGASAWGTDWIGESKVASPLTKAGPGVGCQDVGHTHATRRRASAAPCWAAASAARLARCTATPLAGAS